MKLFDVDTAAYLQRRAGARHRFMIYFWAARRSDGVIEGLGLWNGEDDRSFSVSGAPRVYQRLPVSVAVDEIISQPGTDVVFTSIRFLGLPAEVRSAMELYELRFAPVELHRALFSPETGDLIAPPTRLFKGWIDRISAPTPEDGGQAEIAFTAASANRALTRALAFKKSDPALSAARNGDRFRRYNDIGKVSVPWGEARTSS